jgi:uncharacterized membrane protein YeiH
VVIAAVLGTIIIGSVVPSVRRILSGVPAPAVRAKPPGQTDAEQVSRVAFRLRDLERRLARTYATVLSLVDALGLGIYAVVGVQKSLDAALSIPAAILVGTINAVGGGLLRDVLTREVPLFFQAGPVLCLDRARRSHLFCHSRGRGAKS